MEIIYGILTVLLIIVSGLLILLVLMQKTKGAEIGAVFGSGAAKAVLGASATTILTKITYWLGAVFIVIVFAMAYISSHMAKTKSVISDIQTEQPVKK